MKGIVMDVKRKYVIVMSNDGGFYRARKEEAHDVGKEISFIPLPEKHNFFSLSNWKLKLSSLAAACTVCGGVWLAAIPRAIPVYAYVSIDINPSVEFSVGNNWTVIKATFSNQDGKELLSTLPNIKGEPIETALDEVITAAKKEGKLQEQGDVWITGVLANQSQPEASAVNKLKQLQTELGTKENVQIQVGTTTNKTRNDAEQLGISPQKYAYYQNATKLGIPMTMQSVQDDSVSKLESILHEKNKTTSIATNPGSQEVAKAPEESNKGNEHGSTVVQQGENHSESHSKNHDGNHGEQNRESHDLSMQNTTVANQTEIPSFAQEWNHNQNENDGQKQNDTGWQGQNDHEQRHTDN